MNRRLGIDTRPRPAPIDYILDTLTDCHNIACLIDNGQPIIYLCISDFGEEYLMK